LIAVRDGQDDVGAPDMLLRRLRPLIETKRPPTSRILMLQKVGEQFMNDQDSASG
jgi:hypothetical protein